MRGGWEDIYDANSASSYINDPFGHSSKEVLYKTAFCSHQMPAYPRQGKELGRRIDKCIYFSFYGFLLVFLYVEVMLLLR